MKTMFELFAQIHHVAPEFADRLKTLKAQNPQIEWYPFRSMDKVNLLSLVGKYFDAVAVGFLGDHPKIIDVGAADGDLSFFDSVGCEVVTVENASCNYNHCEGIRTIRQILESRITFIDKDIDHDFNIEGQYDLILMLDILYHLRNPLGALIGSCQLAKYMILTTRIFEAMPDGKLVHDLPYAYLLTPFEAAPTDPTNYWVPTEAALERLFARSGWRIAKKKYFGYSGNDSSPYDPQKDKRVVALCERVEGYEQLKYGHFITR